MFFVLLTTLSMGYLSFVDDRLYYVVIPLFEQKKVQIRVKYVGEKRKLHLLVKLSNEAVSAMPESVNLQIDAVLPGSVCVHFC
jgi:hypothetical protein